MTNVKSFIIVSFGVALCGRTVAIVENSNSNSNMNPINGMYIFFNNLNWMIIFELWLDTIVFFNKESTKYFEDEEGFIYKKVNENEKTVYYDCLNEPRCLMAARFYKQAKALRMFGVHSEHCPPDSNNENENSF